jgi:hypothetical protein
MMQPAKARFDTRGDNLQLLAESLGNLNRLGLRHHDRNRKDAITGFIDDRCCEAGHGRIRLTNLNR